MIQFGGSFFVLLFSLYFLNSIQLDIVDVLKLFGNSPLLDNLKIRLESLKVIGMIVSILSAM